VPLSSHDDAEVTWAIVSRINKCKCISDDCLGGDLSRDEHTSGLSIWTHTTQAKYVRSL
jgi:hypothetical protein